MNVVLEYLVIYLLDSYAIALFPAAHTALDSKKLELLINIYLNT